MFETELIIIYVMSIVTWCYAYLLHKEIDELKEMIKEFKGKLMGNQE